VQEHTLILQFKVEAWGTPEDMQRRHPLGKKIDQQLQKDRNGELGGGEMDEEAISLYFESVTDPQSAVNTIVEVLRGAQELEGAVVAEHVPAVSHAGQEDTPAGWSVLWPTDYQGEFRGPALSDSELDRLIESALDDPSFEVIDLTAPPEPWWRRWLGRFRKP
jgi:hypothetical protein